MAEQKYLIKVNGQNAYLNVYGNDTIANGRNVNVWTLAAGALSQQWIEKTVSGTTKIYSAINTSYCLDFWTGSSNYGNCDVYTESPSYNQDQAISLVPQGGNIYKVLLLNRNLYLTAEGIGQGANVKWDTASSGKYQLWEFIPVNPTPDPDLGVLIPASTPVDTSKYNATYFASSRTSVIVSSVRTPVPATKSGNTAIIPNVSLSFNQISEDILNLKPSFRYACAAFATAGVLTFYSKYLISPNWMSMSGAYINFGASVDRIVDSSGTPLLKMDRVYSPNFTLTDLKTKIDSGYPVIVHGTGNGTGEEHWVLAIGYNNGLVSKDDLIVMDSVNSSSLEYGEQRTIKEAMSTSYVSVGGVYQIPDIIIVSPK